MRGAREYANLFDTGQYGRLYISVGRHARGRTFHIYVLPDGERAVGNGNGNAPLNANAVEVYGVLGGQPGWTEFYGWLHSGKWCDDFHALVLKRAEEKRKNVEEEKLSKEVMDKEMAAKEAKLLASYK